MARPRIYPRFGGRLELHRERTFDKLSKMKDKEIDLKAVDKILTSFLDTCKKWWWIETGYTLEILDDPKDSLCLVWTIEDTRDASMVYHWLKSKAIKYESRIVRRVNYLIKEGLCVRNVTSEGGGRVADKSRG